MRVLKILLVVTMAMGLLSCASNKSKPENLPDVTEASLDTPSETNIQGETTEQDLEALNNEKQNPADPQTQNVADEFSTPPADQSIAQDQNTPAPEPEMATPNQLSSTEAGAVATTPSEKPAVITALDFDANENGGTINVKTNRDVIFTTRKNDKTNQFIIELENTVVPQKFKRPYVTKEFPGAISNMQAYQAKGAQKTVRIVVQLRGAVEPSVSQNANILSIAASGMAPAAEQQEQVAQQEEPTTSEEQAAETGSEEVPTQDHQIMSNKSFDAFLLGQNKFYGKKISIEVTNQDVREVFKFISEESGLNIILDDDVTGKATMKLRKVPWDQALAILLQSKQLGYIRNGSILRVASLKTLKTESLAAREVMDAQKNLQNVRVQVYPISYAKADELSTQVKDLLTPRGKAAADKRTNTLVVSDIPEVLSKVKALVKNLDTQTPQVLIEAKIIEARDTFQRIVGVQWGATGGSSKVGIGAGGNNIEVAPTLTSNYTHSGAATSLGLSIGNLDVVGNLTTTLQLLESENQIKVLSAPRIIVLDRVEATIEQTTQFPITTTTTTSSSTTISASFQDLKLQLKVKPQITVDGGVIMDVNIVRDIRGQSASSSTGAVEVGKRSANTQVLIENGDTVAIGGIYQSDASNSQQGIPWLSKIPLLGWLFKSNEIRKDKNELVILITPRILNREKAFVRSAEAM